MATQEQIDQVGADVEAIKAAFTAADADAFNEALHDMLVILEAEKVYVFPTAVTPGGGGDPGSSAP